MEMTMRWYGKKHDTVTLKQIRQICYVTGIITTLYEKLPGDVWSFDEIMSMKKDVEDVGLHLAGIESVNVSDAIKTGAPDRDKNIEAYVKTLENLGKADIHTVCYNFMPVFDWTRTELDRKRSDGTTVLAYSQVQIDKLEPEKMFETIKKDMNGSVMPGWEPERMEKVKELFTLYKSIDENQLFANLKYFLEAIMPVYKYDINGIHPDDPSWSVFGLPRIISTQENLKRMMDMVPNKHNGITFCTGSYGTNLNNDLIETIRMLKGRIHFAHVRNLRFNDGMRDFEESAHLSSDGTFNMYEILKALHDTGFEGPIRPDHGRMMWDEKAMPGYGLYDRALGALSVQFYEKLFEKRNNVQITITLKGIQKKQDWNAANIALPSYSIEEIRKKTREKPVWIHFWSQVMHHRIFMLIQLIHCFPWEKWMQRLLISKHFQF